MANEKIKFALMFKNMKQWELAELLKMHEGTLCKKLRKELPEEEQERIIAMIEQHVG